MENQKIERQKPADVQNPGLVWALESYFESQTKEKLEKVNNLVKDATFIVPVMIKKVEPADAEGRVRTEFSLRTLTSKDGKVALPVFSDLEQYSKRPAPEGEQTAVFTMVEVTEILKKGEIRDVVINPFDTRSLTMHMNLQKAPVQANGPKMVKPEDVTTKPLTELPQELCAKLTEVFKHGEGVRRAWLTGMENEGADGLLCVVDFENLNQTMLFQALSKVAGPMMDGKKFFTAAYDTFGKKAVGQALPFYDAAAKSDDNLVM